ncbi:MAG: ribosome biogenesis GTPase [Paracoccaceae bacterium]|jgi:ribosome biogenesis GTPase
MKMPIRSLNDLGWSNFFLSQLTVEELDAQLPLRVSEVHRNAVETEGEAGALRVPNTGEMVDQGVAVGDWLLCDSQSQRPTRILDRKSVLHRRGAGDDPSTQLIAANIDTLFIVSSCNSDFNPSRLERYLALALQADVEPVLVLTKADLCENPASYMDRAKTLLRNVSVELVNAKSAATIEQLMPWCGIGQTVALLGSSGVGKSTITNALTGAELLTQDIREDDAKGKHTTTSRSMHAIKGGGWLIDTPGMRALRMLDVREGVDALFEDVSELAGQCRFNDCAHETEPGCAIQNAIASGALDPARLDRWLKLSREDVRNSDTVAQSHKRSRKLEKTYQAGRRQGKSKRD